MTVENKKKILFYAAVTLMFMTSMSKVLIPNTVFDELQSDLGISGQKLAAMGSAFMCTYAISQYMGQRIYEGEAVRRNFMCVANAQTSFTLPKNFFIELDGMYMHGAQAGNTKIGDMYNLNLTLKKRMFDNKLTIALGAQNIVTSKQRIFIEEETFTRVMTADQPWNRVSAKLSISYNFNAGKSFRAKSVESGSAEDKGRLGGGGN